MVERHIVRPEVCYVEKQAKLCWANLEDDTFAELHRYSGAALNLVKTASPKAEAEDGADDFVPWAAFEPRKAQLALAAPLNFAERHGWKRLLHL